MPEEEKKKKKNNHLPYLQGKPNSTSKLQSVPNIWFWQIQIQMKLGGNLFQCTSGLFEANKAWNGLSSLLFFFDVTWGSRISWQVEKEFEFRWLVVLWICPRNVPNSVCSGNHCSHECSMANIWKWTSDNEKNSWVNHSHSHFQRQLLELGYVFILSCAPRYVLRFFCVLTKAMSCRHSQSLY